MQLLAKIGVWLRHFQFQQGPLDEKQRPYWWLHHRIRYHHGTSGSRGSGPERQSGEPRDATRIGQRRSDCLAWSGWLWLILHHGSQCNSFLWECALVYQGDKHPKEEGLQWYTQTWYQGYQWLRSGQSIEIVETPNVPGECARRKWWCTRVTFQYS